MKRTLITGVGGFTGKYLAPLLAASGSEVHGIVHQNEGSVQGVSVMHELDLADLASVNRAVEQIQPDQVIHLAGIAFVGHGDVEQIYRSNVVGTRQLLQALVGLSKRPTSVVVASSANVYGNAREGVLDEASPLAPANDYGVSKVATEYVASLYKGNLPLIVVRPFNYTGRGQSTQFVIPKIVDHVRKRKQTIELGNLDVARDFSDVRAVAEIYVRLLSEPNAIGGTYNVCSGQAVTLSEVLETVGRLSSHPLQVCVNPAFVRANEVRVLRGSAEKLEAIIGPLPRIPLEETIRWMLDD